MLYQLSYSRSQPDNSPREPHSPGGYIVHELAIAII